MEFPLLVKIESKKIAFIANNLDELPFNMNFKIVKSHVKNSEDFQIDLPYKVINDGVCRCRPYFHIKQENGTVLCRACGLVVEDSSLQTTPDGVDSENESTQEDNGSTGDSRS